VDLEDGFGEAAFLGAADGALEEGVDLDRLCFGRRTAPSGVIRSEGALLERLCLLPPVELLFLSFFLLDGLESGPCFDVLEGGSARDDLDSLIES